MDSTLRLFNNQTYQDEAARVTGVNFYNADGSRREMFDVLADMRERYRANFKTDTERDRAFSQAFGKTDLDTQRGLRIFFDAESIEDARRFSGEIGSAGGLIAKELPSAVSNAVDQTARLKAALGDAADSFARPINDAISGGIKYLLDDEKLSGTELLAGGALAAGAGFGALKFGGRALSRLGGGALGKVMQGMGGLGKLPLPLPVYIVNSRMSLTNQALSDMASGSGATGFGGRTAARREKRRGPGAGRSPSPGTWRRAAGVSCHALAVPPPRWSERSRSVPPLPTIPAGRKRRGTWAGPRAPLLAAWAGHGPEPPRARRSEASSPSSARP